MFHGWIMKMKEVGAESLICVSALGFPQSIKADVLNVYGPTVRLMTLTEMEQMEIPRFHVWDHLIHRHPRFAVEAIGGMKLEPRPTDRDLNLSGKRFVVGDSQEAIDLNELISVVLNTDLRRMLDANEIEAPDEFFLDIMIWSVEQNNYFLQGGQKYKIIALPIRLKVETEFIAIPVSYKAYRKEGDGDVVSWVSSARYVDSG
jgi:hypothetical protein